MSSDPWSQPPSWSLHLNALGNRVWQRGLQRCKGQHRCEAIRSAPGGMSTPHLVTQQSAVQPNTAQHSTAQPSCGHDAACLCDPLPAPPLWTPCFHGGKAGRWEGHLPAARIPPCKSARGALGGMQHAALTGMQHGTTVEKIKEHRERGRERNVKKSQRGEG